MNGSMSKWKPVTNCVPQGLVLGLALLNVFIGDMDSGVKCTLSKFADDSKLSDLVDTLEGGHAIQSVLDRLKSWACVNNMRFHETKCKVLHRDNPKHEWAMKG